MSPADLPSNEADTETSVVPAPEAQTAVAPPASAVDASHASSSVAPDASLAASPDAALEAMPDVAPDARDPAPDAVRQAPDAGADAGPRLKALFPALFVGAPKPIKLRIQQDIQARAPGAFTRQALSAFFRRYTGSTGYLIAVVNGRERFDLDGQPAGPIADEHRQAAREELARRRARHEERRALEEQQRRNRAGLLRDYERTTLTRANSCALTQIDEAELDRVLAIAREEAAQRPPLPAHPPRGPIARHAGADERTARSQTAHPRPRDAGAPRRRPGNGA